MKTSGCWPNGDAFRLELVRDGDQWRWLDGDGVDCEVSAPTRTGAFEAARIAWATCAFDPGLDRLEALDD
jgi:hypothetical protein